MAYVCKTVFKLFLQLCGLILQNLVYTSEFIHNGCARKSWLDLLATEHGTSSVPEARTEILRLYMTRIKDKDGRSCKEISTETRGICSFCMKYSTCCWLDERASKCLVLSF